MGTVLDRLNGAVAGMKPYQPGRPIEEVARELGLDPRGIVKLASNENALGPSPRAVEAVEAAALRMHLYPDGGTWELRHKIAEHHGLAPEQVIPGNGSNEILELIGHCFCRPGANAVFSAHAFIVYKLVTALFGAEAREIPMAEGLVHDLDAMAAAVDADTAVVFLCNPNNPTGTICDVDKIRRFIASLPADCLVVLDEAYAEISPDPLPPSVDWLADFPNLLICRTFSKGYGLAGLRVGYGLAEPALIQALNQARQPFNVNLLAQAAAIAALADVDYLARSKGLVAAAKRQFEQLCADRNLRCIPSSANFVLIEVPDGAAVAADLQARGIIVRPLAPYQLPNWIRVTYGLAQENLRFFATVDAIVPAKGGESSNQ